MVVQMFAQEEVADENVVEDPNYFFSVMFVVVVVEVWEHQLFEMDLAVWQYRSIDYLASHCRDDHVTGEVQTE